MPQQRLTVSQRIFYLGLLLMLATGILSTTLPAQDNPIVAIMMVTAAIMALTARIWQHYIHRAARQQDTTIDLSGYPFNMLNNPRFTSPRRPAA